MGKISKNSIRRNGEYLDEDLVERYRRTTAFVPQDDVMHRELITRDVLRFQAETRSEHVDNPEGVQANVISLLEAMGFRDIEKIKDRIIGDEIRKGLSGGERKRISIGMELMQQQELICMDEPTSALDSTVAYRLFQMLKELSKTMTIVAVVHQPSLELLELADRIIIMNNRKRVAFSGELSDLIARKLWLRPSPRALNPPRGVDPKAAFLDYQLVKKEDVVPEAAAAGTQRILAPDAHPTKLENPLDAYMQFLTLTKDEFESLETTHKLPTPPLAISGLARPNQSLFSELKNQIRRSVNSIYTHDNGAALLSDVITWFIAIIIICLAMSAFTLIQQLNQLAIGAGLMMILFSQYSCVRVFAPRTERAVFEREMRHGLSIFPYYFAKVIAMIPKMILFATVFLIQYAFIDTEIRLSIYFLAMLVAAVASFALGFAVSAWFDEVSSLTIVVLTSIVSFILSGSTEFRYALFSGNEGAVSFFTFFTPIRWSMDILFSELFDFSSEFSRLCVSPKILSSYNNAQPIGQKVGGELGLAAVWFTVAFIGVYIRKNELFVGGFINRLMWGIEWSPCVRSFSEWLMMQRGCCSTILKNLYRHADNDNNNDDKMTKKDDQDTKKEDERKEEIVIEMKKENWNVLAGPQKEDSCSVFYVDQNCVFVF